MSEAFEQGQVYFVATSPNQLFGNDVYFSDPLYIAHKPNIDSDSGDKTRAFKEVVRGTTDSTLRTRLNTAPLHSWSAADTEMYHELFSRKLWRDAEDYAERHLEASLDDETKQWHQLYLTFSLGALVHTYVQIARAGAHPEIAPEYVPRLKYMVTECWPAVRKLEKYAPAEAAGKKQILREILLEYAVQGITLRDIERYLELLSGKNFDIEQEKQDTLEEFYRMECSPERAEEIEAIVRERAQALFYDRHYEKAINALATLRYCLPHVAVQDEINQIAERGLKALLQVIDPAGPPNYEIAVLLENEFVSPGVKRRYGQMIESQRVNAHVKAFVDNPANHEALLDVLSHAYRHPHAIPRAVRDTIFEQLRNINEYALNIDRMLEAYLRICSTEQYMQVTHAHILRIVERMKEPNYDFMKGFEQFLAVISPAIRMQEEAGLDVNSRIWELIDIADFQLYFETFIATRGEDVIHQIIHTTRQDQEDEVNIREEYEAAMADILSWWHKTWDNLQEYCY